MLLALFYTYLFPLYCHSVVLRTLYGIHYAFAFCGINLFLCIKLCLQIQIKLFLSNRYSQNRFSYLSVFKFIKINWFLVGLYLYFSLKQDLLDFNMSETNYYSLLRTSSENYKTFNLSSKVT